MIDKAFLDGLDAGVGSRLLDFIEDCKQAGFEPRYEREVIVRIVAADTWVSIGFERDGRVQIPYQKKGVDKQELKDFCDQVAASIGGIRTSKKC
ncbi:MAG: hypothetical protein NT133_13915 [Alphaproteobacteria bacterium]|nr:hypothetical protein [Alphaproteobacteria bacterium]